MNTPTLEPVDTGAITIDGAWHHFDTTVRIDHIHRGMKLPAQLPELDRARLTIVEVTVDRRRRRPYVRGAEVAWIIEAVLDAGIVQTVDELDVVGPLLDLRSKADAAGPSLELRIERTR